MTDREKIEAYDGPAGGMGALASSMRHVARQGAPLRTTAALLQLNQHAGFDCPGCAWPDPDEPATFEFCENGIKAVAAEATGRRADPEFFARHTVTELAAQTDFELEDHGRLTHPMRYDAASDKYLPVPWDEAFATIGAALRALASPDEAIFYTSGRTSNEAAFLYQLFGRLFGTNNFPDCSNMCHESSGVALKESIGVGKGTVLLEDFALADAIFVIGQNPGTNHPRMLTTLQEAHRRGTKIVAINPLKERGLERFAHPKKPLELLGGTGTPIATHYAQPLIGGDLAVLHGMAKVVLDAEERAPGTVLDHAFIRGHTSGFDDYAARVRAIDWATIERQSGLTRVQLEELAGVYTASQRVIVCWAMGLTQHKHAVPTIQAIANLLLLRGNIGRPGGGACPVRGHSNVQGDRTVGITEKPAAEFLDRLGAAFAFEPPRAHGLDTVGAIEAMAEGRARVFVSMGGNFAAATPDAEYTWAALRRCHLTVQIATKLNRSHVVHGREALLLPCLSRSERDGNQRVTVEDSMSMVHGSSGRNAPASPHLLSEPAIVAGIAKATLGARASHVPWDDFVADYARIRAKIAEVIPAFADSEARIRRPGGFHLGNTARDRQWDTPTGKANFLFHAIPDLTLPDGQLRLMTIRSHDQYNTTIYGHDDRYRGIYGTRRVILMHADDVATRGLADGDVVDIASHFDDGRSRVARAFRVVAYDIPRGCAAAYFPEANVLVPVGAVADGSRTPVSKFVPVSVARAAQPVLRER
ncbi:MAG: FdhF/YdeP family oxidoreductase [Candidatus Sumerlaeia bacterium]|nr:FdhF/YdeP family oxidoreductase [Candidatus Sumerlaeia bacterium]